MFLFRSKRFGGDTETAVDTSRFMGLDVWKCFTEGVQSERGDVIVFSIGSFVSVSV